MYCKYMIRKKRRYCKYMPRKNKITLSQVKYAPVKEAHSKTSLEGQRLPGNAPDAVLHVIPAVQAVAVGDLARPEVALRGDVLTAAVRHVANGSEAVGLGVLAKDNLPALSVLEYGRLNADLGAHAGIDARGADGQVVVVIDVDGAEADGGVAGVDVKPVVVSVGDVELALVLLGVAV